MPVYKDRYLKKWNGFCLRNKETHFLVSSLNGTTCIIDVDLCFMYNGNSVRLINVSQCFKNVYQICLYDY